MEMAALSWHKAVEVRPVVLLAPLESSPVPQRLGHGHVPGATSEPFNTAYEQKVRPLLRRRQQTIVDPLEQFVELHEEPARFLQFH